MRCVFIHIGIPGQEKGAADLETFPSMQVFPLVVGLCPLLLFLLVTENLHNSFQDIEFAESID